MNLSVLCGLRLGSAPFALLAVTLVMLPGLVSITLALAFLSTDAPWFQAFLHGILIGVLASSLARRTSQRRRRFDGALALARFS